MISVVDYGMGNLRSVSKALESLGGRVQVTSDPGAVKASDKLVLPGVGAFGDAVSELKTRGLWEPLAAHIRAGKSFFGICLGLQLLLSESEESPGLPGLGIFPGKVIRFRSGGIKIPHMGWNQVEYQGKHPLLAGVPSGSSFYFVHSFYAAPQEAALGFGRTLYGQENFAAVLAQDRVFATQFHPEKSQEAGLRILKNFLEW